MEVIQPTPAVHKIRGSDARALEQIAALGYQDQNNKLIEAGFNKPSQNLTLLRKNNGDVEAVLKVFTKRATRKALKEEKSNPNEKEGKKEKRPRSDRPPKTERKEKRVPRERSEKKDRDQRNKQALSKRLASKYQEWPTEIKCVFLDGNSMLFTDRLLLKLRMSGDQKGAEEALSQLASAFTKAKGCFSNVLIFDSIKMNTSNGSFIAQDGKSYEMLVCSARPSFATSDDALLEWMENVKNPEECLVVTSDVELQFRLKEKGVSHLMKTQNWFKLVKQTLGDEYSTIVGQLKAPKNKKKDTPINN